MNKPFYPKLALINLKKNASVYVPYLLTCILSIVTFYTMAMLCFNPGLLEMRGSEALQAMFSFGTIIIGIFCLIFLFYTNSFLIKRRKKELGLYSILGMEKKHIAIILFFETLFAAIIAFVLGLLSAVLLSKLLFALLLNLLQFPTTITANVSVEALVLTIAVFGGIFLLTLLYNLRHIQLAKPIELIRSAKQGEKEPKASIVLTILGVLFLSAGYYIALTVKTPIDALALFFVAVLLVILGTYALFTSGSIALLKMLKRNKSYFYKPNHFISVSGMIYRMKQNAVGLANICILCSMVLVTVATTVSLYTGVTDMINNQYPSDMEVQVYGEQDIEAAYQAIEKVGEQNNVQVVNLHAVRMNQGYAGITQTGFVNEEEMQDLPGCGLFLVPLEDFNKLTGASYTLVGNDVLFYSDTVTLNSDAFTIGDMPYTVKTRLDAIPAELEHTNTSYIILRDVEAVKKAYRALFPDREERMNCKIAFDLEGNEAHILNFAEQVQTEIGQQVESGYGFSSKHEAKRDWYALYGGFLYLGIFLGALFLMATVLIIYYKQVSEGYDDHDRFVIMQQVGMSRQEVRKTIRKQILMVFFLPLIGAIIHIAFALRVITKMLMLFGLSNTNLVLLCTAVTVVLFILIYAFVYTQTAKIYYKLVQETI